jgi:uncharacterized protein (TIGR02246 family)
VQVVSVIRRRPKAAFHDDDNNGAAAFKPPSATFISIHNEGERDMRDIVSVLAITLAVTAGPALAQQKPAPAATAMARAQAFTAEVNSTFNKKDPAAVAALFTADALLVGPDGTRVQGRKALVAYFTTTFGTWGNFTYTATVKEAHPIGNGMWADVSSTIQTSGPAGTLKSHLADILIPEGKGWKLRFVSVGPDAAPPGMPAQPASK